MPNNRRVTREKWVALLQAQTTATVEANRAHQVSDYPLINVMTGVEQAEIEDNTLQGKPRVLEIVIEIYVASNNHDDDIDAFITIIDDIIEANPKTPEWSSCQFDSADAPETVGGKYDYSVCRVHLLTKYEV